MSLCLLCRRLSYVNRGVLFRASSKVPSESLLPEAGPVSAASVDVETIKHLERLSLVDFANKRGIIRLEEAIKFADKLDTVDTSDVEPLVSVLEDEVLFLRKDQVTEINDVKVVMSNALVKEEDYYVAPPGNIPLISQDPDQLK